MYLVVVEMEISLSFEGRLENLSYDIYIQWVSQLMFHNVSDIYENLMVPITDTCLIEMLTLKK